MGNSDSQTWGYRFAGERAINNLIRELDGRDAFDRYVSRDIIGRAETFLSDVTGNSGALFYVRRQEINQRYPDEEIWELTVASDTNSALPSPLEDFKKTLWLKATINSNNGSGGLKLLDARLVDLPRGKVDGFCLPFCLQLASNNRLGVPRATVAKIKSLPLWSERHVPTSEQLKVWRVFLDMEERIAKARQFCVPFDNHNYSYKSRRVTFIIHPASATLDGSPKTSLGEDEFWLRIKKSKQEDLMICRSASDIATRKGTKKLGSIDAIDAKNHKIKVLLDDDLVDRLREGLYKLPARGFLYFEAAGDIHQINQKKKALEHLRLGRTQNPNLSKFLFDATQARNPDSIVKLSPQNLLKSNSNFDQIAAVETVLSAPDMVLIQGPPGTGKTTVIVEICYQIALRGGKTLIASQANLAVDNALSRLVHNPVIRGLRRGKAEKVQAEGQAFLEENVINQWVGNTASDCEERLSTNQDRVKVLQELLAPQERFGKYLQSESEWIHQQQEFQERKLQLEQACKQQEEIYQTAIAKTDKLESLLVGLKKIIKPASKMNWLTEEVVSFLPQLQPYAKGDSVVDQFIANIKTAIHDAGELSFTPPKCGAFGLAAWLKNTVAKEIESFPPAFSGANDAITVMSEVGVSVQNFRSASESANTLHQGYHKLLGEQQELAEKIRRTERRRSEIGFIIGAVRDWKANASQRLHKILNRCRQTGKPITEKVLELPSGLITIASSSRLSLVPIDYQVRKVDHLPNWQQLYNAFTYELEKGCINAKGKTSKFSEFMNRTLGEIPLVLIGEHRQQWQDLAEKFADYYRLKPPERQPLVREAGSLLIQLQAIYGESWNESNVNATLKQIVEELKESILANARECVFPLKAETEQYLENFQKQAQEVEIKLNNAKSQIDQLENDIETIREDSNIKLTQAVTFLQELSQKPELPKRLGLLVEEYINNQSYIWENPHHFSAEVAAWENNLNRLIKLIPDIDPLKTLKYIKNNLDTEVSNLKLESDRAKEELQISQNKITELEEQIQAQLPKDLAKERKWWQNLWKKISNDFHFQINFQPNTVITTQESNPKQPNNIELYNLDFLTKIKRQLEFWQKELQEKENYLNRYQNFVQDWIKKLRQPSQQDIEDLKQIYLDNANVVGITCVQAARGDFSREFPSFDVVIIDEVSKCTPPELLIPALKGKKIVLVGDHRQLPPMLRDDTIEDIAEEIGTTKDELKFIKESLFKTQFESADENIKRMLTIQYRMHPQIMGAINQFYQDKLSCGLPEPDSLRAHNLSGELLQANQHILWLKTPIDNDFNEKREGTSRINIKEVDAIEKLCEQLETAWSSKVQKSNEKKEIGIITFYGAQLRLIKDRIAAKKFPSLDIRTGTVDIFQGMERPVIIVSTVCNNFRGDIGFAKAPERVNVAFSRAQELLVVVGCYDLFTQQSGKVGSMYQEVARTVDKYGGLIDVSYVL